MKIHNAVCDNKEFRPIAIDSKLYGWRYSTVENHTHLKVAIALDKSLKLNVLPESIITNCRYSDQEEWVQIVLVELLFQSHP